MALTDNTSNLMLFGALMMARDGKARLADAVRAVPVSERTQRLVKVLAAPGAAEQCKPVAAGDPPVLGEVRSLADQTKPCFAETGALHPVFGSGHVTQGGPVTEILTHSMHMRCPVCSAEATFDLDTWELEHLSVRGHLDRYCHFCGTETLWETASGPERHLSDLFI